MGIMAELSKQYRSDREKRSMMCDELEEIEVEFRHVHQRALAVLEKTVDRSDSDSNHDHDSVSDASILSESNDSDSEDEHQSSDPEKTAKRAAVRSQGKRRRRKKKQKKQLQMAVIDKDKDQATSNCQDRLKKDEETSKNKTSQHSIEVGHDMWHPSPQFPLLTRDSQV